MPQEPSEFSQIISNKVSFPASGRVSSEGKLVQSYLQMCSWMLSVARPVVLKTRQAYVKVAPHFRVDLLTLMVNCSNQTFIRFNMSLATSFHLRRDVPASSWKTLYKIYLSYAYKKKTETLIGNPLMIWLTIFTANSWNTPTDAVSFALPKTLFSIG